MPLTVASAAIAGHATLLKHPAAKPVDAGKAVRAALTDLHAIQHRKTRDRRVEDGIKSIGLADGSVAVTLKPNQPYDAALLEKAVKTLLAAHGLRGLQIALIPTQPAAVAKKQAAVDKSWMQIFDTQHRLTTDIRAEDDIVGLSLDGDTVRIALRAHANESDDAIQSVVARLLDAHGFPHAKLALVRPAIDPVPPPSATSPAFSPPGPMKQAVSDFAAEIAKVHARTTDDLRVEDGVKSLTIKGARVMLHTQRCAVDDASVVAFVKDELKKRGVLLPLTVIPS